MQEPTPRENGARLPLIGEDAPPFVADTTQGRLNFPDDYKGKKRGRNNFPIYVTAGMAR